MVTQWEFRFTSDYFPGFGQGISQAQTVPRSHFRALLFSAHQCQIFKDANTAQCVTVLFLQPKYMYLKRQFSMSGFETSNDTTVMLYRKISSFNNREGER